MVCVPKNPRTVAPQRAALLVLRSLVLLGVASSPLCATSCALGSRENKCALLPSHFMGDASDPTGRAPGTGESARERRAPHRQLPPRASCRQRSKPSVPCDDGNCLQGIRGRASTFVPPFSLQAFLCLRCDAGAGDAGTGRVNDLAFHELTDC